MKTVGGGLEGQAVQFSARLRELTKQFVRGAISQDQFADSIKKMTDATTELIALEEEARKLANASGGDETREIRHSVYRTGGDPWLDPLFSTCVELMTEGEPSVIIRDYASA